MKSLDIINVYYQTNMVAKSAYFDNEINKIRQALQDARWRKQEMDTEWYAINSMIALQLTENLMHMVLKGGAPRKFLESLYKQIIEED